MSQPKQPTPITTLATNLINMSSGPKPTSTISPTSTSISTSTTSTISTSTTPTTSTISTTPTKKKSLKISAAKSRKSFKLYDCNSYDHYTPASGPGTYPTNTFRIELYGIDEVGERCVLFVTDMRPFFYVRVDQQLNGMPVKQRWDAAKTKRFANFINKKIGKFNVTARLEEHQSMDMFSNRTKFQFVRLEFPSMGLFKKTKNLWYTGDYQSRTLSQDAFAGSEFGHTKLKLYESNMLPILRFFHMHNINPSGWIEIDICSATVPDELTTSCEYEFEVSSQDITPLPLKIARVPYLMASFDIEADSSHGDFPVPIKDYKKPTLQIVDLLQRHFEGKSPIEVRTLFDKVLRKMFGFLPPHIQNLPELDTVYPKVGGFTFVRKPAAITNSPKTGKTNENYITYAYTTEAKKWVASIKNIFESSISTISKNADPGALAALAVGYEFEQLRLQQGPETDEHDDGGDGEHDAKEAADTDAVEETTNNIKKLSLNWEKPKTVANEWENSNLYDILAASKISRDQKIQYVNYLLTVVLPPLEGDKVTFIGTSFIRYGAPEPHSHHEFVLGNCSPVDGMVVHPTKSERDLLIQWGEMMRAQKPDIIMGYNIKGFDYEYMFRRAQENNCVAECFNFSKKTSELGIITKVNYKHNNNNNNEPIEPTENEYTTSEITAQHSKINPDETLLNTSVKLAAGEFRMSYPQLSGILQIDLLFYCRRNENYSSYKLDDVVGMNICDDVVDTSILEESSDLCLHCFNTVGLHVGDYICIEYVGITSSSAYFVDSTTGDKKKIQVKAIEIGPPNAKGITEKRIVVDGGYATPIFEQGCKHSKTNVPSAYKWGLAKDDVTPQQIFKLARGSDDDRATIAKYCRADCNHPIFLAAKMDVITGYSEMANICSTPISFLILRGQGIKLHSYVGKICRQEGVLMPDIEKGERFVYDGAYVLTPKRDMYVDNPVTTLDYASLYPSIASGWGFSTDGKVWTMDYDLDGNKTGETGIRDPKNPNNFLYDNLPGYRYNETTYPLKKGTKKKCWVVGSRRCRWAIDLNGRQTIIPKVVTVLMGERASTRKQIKTEPDPFTANILDKRQLGYKVSANSVYGQTGSSVSAFADVDVAASITSVGRLMIIYARTVIERVYADSIYVSESHGTVRTRSSYVYGDTDSVFSTFNLEDPVTGQPVRGTRALAISIELAKEAAVLASMFLPPPMKLTYEKTFLNFIILSKKRYVGILYDDDHPEGYLKFMGLQIKKRDTCDCVKDIFGDIMMMFINNPTDIGSIINYFNASLEQIISGELPLDKFIQTKSLRGSYTNPLGIAHNVLANRIGDREPGTRPKPGDRIGYAFVKTKLAPGSGSGKDGKILNGDKIETLAYIKQHKLEIDYEYYITNHVKKPLLQMFGLALLPILNHFKQTKDIEIYYDTMSNFTQQAEGDLAVFNVLAEKYCAKAVSAILFDPFIRKLYCKTNRLQPITSFFTPRARSTNTSTSTTTNTTINTTINKLASYSGVEKANFR